MRKSIVWISIIFIAILTLFMVWVFNNAQEIANEIIRDEIIKKYNQNSNSKYQISIEEIKLNIISGSIKLKKIYIHPKDSLVVLERTFDGKLVNSTFFELSINEISLSGFEILDALNNRIIEAENFKIYQPSVQIYHHQGISKEEQVMQDTVDFRTVFLANYDSLKLNRVRIQDASTTYHSIDTKNDTSEIFTITNLSYKLKNITANQQTLYSDFYFEVEEYSLNSKNIEVQLNNQASISVESIHFNSTDKDLEIAKFNYHPESDATAFFKQLKYKKGWVDFEAKKITISDVDLNHWFKNQEFYASSLAVKDPVLHIHSKDDLPFDHKETKPMLGEMITQLPFPFYIENSTLENVEINMEITGKMTSTHGKLQFHNMNIKASNLTNIPNQISINPYLEINASTKINKTGNIDSYLKINLESDISLTQFSLNATKMKFKNFNSILKPIVRVSLTEGQMVSLKINSTLSTNGAFGTMNAHYTNLKLQLESKDLSKKPGFFNNMASGIANGILKTDNIPETEDYRVGRFHIKKTKHDNFFKMLWLITLNGLEDSILGSESKDQREKRKQEKKKSAKKKLFNF